MIKSYFTGSFSRAGSSSKTLAATQSTTPPKPFRSALARAISTAEADTSTAVTRFAPPRAAFKAKDPVWVKQSSTVLPSASRPTARRLYFWSRKKPVFCPFSTSTKYFTPFSTISVTGESAGASPGRGNHSLYCSSPSFSRRGTSFRSKTPRTACPSSRRIRTKRGSSRSLILSMPTDSTWTLRRSWNLSTVRPGNMSASPKMTRQASKSSGAMTVFRYSQAQRSFRSQKAASKRSLAFREIRRTRIFDFSDKKPVPKYAPFRLRTSTSPPFSSVPSIDKISAS